jgi:hypothetical protein
VKIQRVVFLWAGLLLLALNSYAAPPMSFTAFSGVSTVGHFSLSSLLLPRSFRSLTKTRPKPVTASPTDVLRESPTISQPGELLNLRHDDLVRALTQA